MKIEFRKMEEKDRQIVFDMMRDFYNSSAVISTPDDSVLLNDIKACVSDNIFADGIIAMCDGEIAGYGMVTHSFSTEFGGKCLWLEDLYLKEEYRGLGIGTKYFEYIEKVYGDKCAVQRLEVERDNEGAIRNYKRNGFKVLDYMEMVR